MAELYALDRLAGFGGGRKKRGGAGAAATRWAQAPCGARHAPDASLQLQQGQPGQSGQVLGGPACTRLLLARQALMLGAPAPPPPCRGAEAAVALSPQPPQPPQPPEQQQQQQPPQPPERQQQPPGAAAPSFWSCLARQSPRLQHNWSSAPTAPASPAPARPRRRRQARTRLPGGAAPSGWPCLASRRPIGGGRPPGQGRRGCAAWRRGWRRGALGSTHCLCPFLLMRIGTCATGRAGGRRPSPPGRHWRCLRRRVSRSTQVSAATAPVCACAV